MPRGQGEQLLLLGVIALGVWAALSYLKKGLGSATAPISTAVADLYNWFTLGPPIQASGVVVFQNGTTVPVASIAGGITFDSANGVGVFTYNGTRYAIDQGSRDANGNYPAVPYSSVLAAAQGGASLLQPVSVTAAANYVTPTGTSSSSPPSFLTSLEQSLNAVPVVF